MSQRSEKMNRRMDKYESRLKDLEIRWDNATRYAANERYRTSKQFDDLRNERHLEAANRKKWDRVNRVLVTILLSLSAAVAAVYLFDMLHPAPAIEEPQAAKTAVQVVMPQAELGRPVYYDVPMSRSLQDDLRAACEESGVDMPLALAVIQRETKYQNQVGDSGNSYGYMQVQPKWHQGRMERLGVTDLMDPVSNFRTGCDYLAECLDRYPVDQALGKYNSGKPEVNQYAVDVMQSYAEIKVQVI